MDSLPAYTSITGGGRLGKKKNRTRAIMSMAPARFSAMPDNLLQQRRSWPVGFRMRAGLYMTRQECMSTYALWSGFRETGRRIP